MRVKKYNKATFPLSPVELLNHSKNDLWRCKDGYMYIRQGNEFALLSAAYKENDPLEQHYSFIIVLETEEETVRKILDKVV